MSLMSSYCICILCFIPCQHHNFMYCESYVVYIIDIHQNNKNSIFKFYYFAAQLSSSLRFLSSRSSAFSIADGYSILIRNHQPRTDLCMRGSTNIRCIQGNRLFLASVPELTASILMQWIYICSLSHVHTSEERTLSLTVLNLNMCIYK